MEPLAQWLGQNLGISRVPIPESNEDDTRTLAYMDYLNAMSRDKWSVKRVLKHTQVYKAAAGSKLNMRKST